MTLVIGEFGRRSGVGLGMVAKSMCLIACLICNGAGEEDLGTLGWEFESFVTELTSIVIADETKHPMAPIINRMSKRE